MEEYLSGVRHDLRNELLVAREGISQVLDGLGNKDCRKCFQILKEALDGADQLNKKIQEQLGPAGVKSILENQNQKQNALEKDDLETVKDQLASMISHEVRTPLTIIKDGVSLVLDEMPEGLNAEQKKYLTEARQNIDRLVAALEKILRTPWDKIVKLYNESFPR